MALVARDEAQAKLHRHGEQAARQHEREREEALSALSWSTSARWQRPSPPPRRRSAPSGRAPSRRSSSLRAKHEEALAS